MSNKHYSYCVYISRSLKDGTLYKGLTNNLDKRQLEHDLGKSNYTRRKLPYELVWYFTFTGNNAQEKAIQFEKYLKSGSGREFVKKFITNSNTGACPPEPSVANGEINKLL